MRRSIPTPTRCPEGFPRAAVRPAAAHFEKELGEFILPYEAVRTTPDPARCLMEFLQSTYERQPTADTGTAPRSNALSASAGGHASSTDGECVRAEPPRERAPAQRAAGLRVFMNETASGGESHENPIVDSVGARRSLRARYFPRPQNARAPGGRLPARSFSFEGSIGAKLARSAACPRLGLAPGLWAVRAEGPSRGALLTTTLSMSTRVLAQTTRSASIGRPHSARATSIGPPCPNRPIASIRISASTLPARFRYLQTGFRQSVTCPGLPA